MQKIFINHIAQGLILFFLLSIGLNVHAQNNSLKIGIGFNGGLEAGWWIYNKGYNDTLPGSHLGYDRTHLAFVIPFEINLSIKKAKWFLDFGVGTVRIGDNVMIGSEDQRGGRTRYGISTKNAVSASKIFLKGGKSLIAKPKYSLFPTLALGLFNIQTTHPDRNNFQKRWYWKVAFESHIHRSDWVDLIVSPSYTNMKITTSTEAEHDIYSVGLDMGIRIWLR